MDAGAQGGHQEVQGAAAAVPAGSPAPDGPPHAVIDRSRVLTRTACVLFSLCYSYITVLRIGSRGWSMPWLLACTIVEFKFVASCNSVMLLPAMWYMFSFNFRELYAERV